MIGLYYYTLYSVQVGNKFGLTFSRSSRNGLAAHSTILCAGKLRPPAASVTSTRSPWHRSSWTAETSDVPQSPHVNEYSEFIGSDIFVALFYNRTSFSRFACFSSFFLFELLLLVVQYRCCCYYYSAHNTAAASRSARIHAFGVFSLHLKYSLRLFLWLLAFYLFHY